MFNLEEIISFITHGSLNKYKFNNSKATQQEINIEKATKSKNWKSARVAVTNSKEDLTSGKGHIVASEEALIQYADKYTHWTPNPYNYLEKDIETNTINKRTKDNVKQINTFVLDIDVDLEYNDLVQKLISCSFANNTHDLLPNLYVKTPRGWHLYYVVDTPFYAKGERKKALMTAEKIHKSLAHALSEYLPIDKNCVSTGFFRMPNNSNVINFKNEYISSEALKQWSMKYAKDNNIEMNSFKVLRGRFNSSLTPEWVDYLLNKADISSVGMGVGRNNVTFTLALYFKSVDKSVDEAIEALQAFNKRLNAPLSNRELYRTVKSAYKGEYSGASREHVESLLEAFSDDEVVYHNSFVSINGWYKFAKPREKRTRSHYSERQSDLEAMLDEKTSKEHVFLTGSTTNISKALGMARSTFNVVIKTAQKNGTVIKRTIGKGRNAETFIALKSVYMERLFDLVQMVKDKKQDFSKALRGLLDMENHTKDLMVQNPGLYEEAINTFNQIEHMTEIRPSLSHQVAIGTRFIS